MKIKPFALERYFAGHEFSARYLLSSSDCEALTLAEVLETADAEARRLWDHLKLGYTETPGHPVLREAIADMYRGLTAEDVLVVVPEEGIFLLMQTLLEPGDHLICTFPGYQSLYEVAAAMGCQVTRWSPDESRGWHFNPRDLEAMFRDNTRLLVVNFPHNPTGFVPTREEFEEVLALAAGRNIHVFSDEMYRSLEFDGEALPAGAEVYDRAVSLSGLSKAYGLPGLRIGWVATRDRELLESMSRLKDYITICNSAPSEILALMAVRARADIIGRQRGLIHKNLGVLRGFFDSHQDLLQCQSPRGGSICFPHLTAVADTFAFCEKLVAETGIMLVPSRMFDYGDGHVRVGFGRRDLPEVLSRFSVYLEAKFR
jgi:aspartate/methionine/tyrosine aminotransferase